MSLPRDILDQLLSGYVDDALSNEERTQLEQLLREDAGVAQELEELRELRSTLREIHRTNQQYQLEANFADRVLKAAVDQAATEGLGEEHPVMMLAQQPSTSVSPRRSIPWAKIAGAVAAIAASTIVAISLLRGPNEDPNKRPIAQAPQQPVVEPGPNLVDVESPKHPDVEMPATNEATTNNDTTNKIVQTPVVRSPEVVDEPQDPVVVKDKTPELDVEAMLKGYVFVLNIHQSDPNAVASAMKAAGLKPTKNKQIDKSIVGFDGEKPDDAVSVLYIGSTAKKIDLFVNQVYFVTEGIESIGFGHVLSAPIAKVGVKLDATKVRHVSWELKDDDGDSVKVLANKLAELAKPSDTPRKGVPVPTKGGDFPSQIFVVVRNVASATAN